MKRKAFILTEILTGMMLQVMFAIVLCGAFYMILNFSTSTQQGFAANDKGQMVITYFDSRIRNAGLGMWGCHGSKDIRLALGRISALKENTPDPTKNLCLPVAVTSDDKVSSDGRFYRGNVIVLLYAHKDPNELKDRNKTSPVKLILFTDQAQSSRDVKSTSSNFDLIDKAKNGLSSYINSDFARSGKLQDIRNYAVIERSGIPIYTQTATNNQIGLMAPYLKPVTIYPMSELLNLECQKLYTKKDSNGYNFVFQELNENGGWGQFYYHTKDILDLYMTLDTRPNTSDKIPIFELRVLVSEGINELGTTSKPKDWPGRWTADFSRYKVHVSKASWKLYNLAPQFAN